MPEPNPNPEVAIELRGVGIEYRRYRQKMTTLKQNILTAFRGNRFESFWALKDVDVVIRKGESVGIIGPNGSGKSTMLKAIAGVLKPSRGKVLTTGRIAPLIELGGGFNMDLTGRENIFLNGAIMGLSRKEMNAKMEGIITFADLGDFIDAPLSTYSNGMRSRLGFAVASDIDPDILLLDEIFSVGDAVFQAKASARTEAFFRSHRTVVLVSHALDLVSRLCERAIFVHHGEVVADGPPSKVIPIYMEKVGLKSAPIAAPAASKGSTPAQPAPSEGAPS